MWCTGPEIDILFSGGACLLNETAFLKGAGDLTVDCIAPSVTVKVLPATLTSPYKNATKFTDKVCHCSRQNEVASPLWQAFKPDWLDICSVSMRCTGSSRRSSTFIISHTRIKRKLQTDQAHHNKAICKGLSCALLECIAKVSMW